MTFRTSPIVSARRSDDQRLSEASASTAGGGRRARADQGSRTNPGVGQTRGRGEGRLAHGGKDARSVRDAPWTLVDGAATLPVVTVTHEPDDHPARRRHRSRSSDRDGSRRSTSPTRAANRCARWSGFGPSPASASRAIATRSGPATTRPIPKVDRQITLIAAEELDRLADAEGISLSPAESRRNVLTRGIRCQRARRPPVPRRRRRVRGHPAVRALPVPDGSRRQGHPHAARAPGRPARPDPERTARSRSAMRSSPSTDGGHPEAARGGEDAQRGRNGSSGSRRLSTVIAVPRGRRGGPLDRVRDHPPDVRVEVRRVGLVARAGSRRSGRARRS